jgi:hypothetical protein
MGGKVIDLQKVVAELRSQMKELDQAIDSLKRLKRLEGLPAAAKRPYGRKRAKYGSAAGVD